MVDQITINVTNNNQTSRQATINVEDKKLISSVFPNFANNTITEQQFQKLVSTAARNGDMGVLEKCDLSPKESIQLANINGYSEFYDLKLSDDGKYIEVTIKETGCLYPDPKAQTIVRDFGLEPGVLYKNNTELLQKNYDDQNGKGSHNNMDPHAGDSYNHVKLRANDVVKIPVGEFTIQDSPSGFWGRFFSIS